MGKLSGVEKAEAKVRLSKEIKEAAKRAIELDPSHFKAYMILGIWHRKVEDASWMEQQLAKAFFGGLPEASLSEAERNLKKSIELKADFIESHYEFTDDRDDDKCDTKEREQMAIDWSFGVSVRLKARAEMENTMSILSITSKINGVEAARAAKMSDAEQYLYCVTWLANYLMSEVQLKLEI